MQIKKFIKTANFSRALSLLQNKLMNDDTSLSEEEVQFFNQCLVYVFLKLKEFHYARVLSEEILQKLKRQGIFSFDEQDEIPYPLRYLHACSNYEMKNSRDALSQLYGILRDLEKQKSQQKGQVL